jgi:hypothetical protein
VVDVFTFSLFKKHIETSDMELKDVILENASEIFERFLMRFDLP